MYEIILGRTKSDLQTYSKKGSVLIGKQYVVMGQEYSLSNPIYLDVLRTHAILICGKRGGGKSYTMGSICEGLFDIEREISKKLCFILMDTMGAYWSMKYPNEKDKDILRKWGLEGKGLDVKIYVPGGFFEKYREDGIPVDYPFYIKPNELTLEDWLSIFEITNKDYMSVIISLALEKLKGLNFDIQDIIEEIKKLEKIDEKDKLLVINYFLLTNTWGIFSSKGFDINSILEGGSVVIIDTSAYISMPGGQMIRSLVLGIFSKIVFVNRVLVRKNEEKQTIENLTKVSTNYNIKKDLPMTWLIVDEAHEFLPLDEMVPSSKPLITILREGRQPGVSLILATQQPGKIHTDAITQSDIVISHRITAAIDLESLDRIFLSYDTKGSKALFNSMPKTKGCAIICDDKNERIYTMQVKPRISWHGGEDPIAIEEIKDEFDLD